MISEEKDAKQNQVKNVDPFEGQEMGIGTWAWGDKLVWGFGQNYSDREVEESFLEAIESGFRFFDTAEVYGQGKSEKFLGVLLPSVQEKCIVASKIMPYPWRLGKDALKKALSGSLQRLGLQKVDLYQMHWPMPPVPIENWMAQMAEVYHEGLIGSVGVSNFNLEQTQRAAEALSKKGIPLASNQVEYHLLERKIEKNGLTDYCQANNIKIIAYSPLAMGILSGKYTPENPPKGARGSQYPRAVLEKIQPLIRMLVRMGMDLEGKSAAQVALNWVIQKGAFPIPGVKNANQVTQNAGALGWKLTPEEVNKLDEMSDSIL